MSDDVVAALVFGVAVGFLVGLFVAYRINVYIAAKFDRLKEVST